MAQKIGRSTWMLHSYPSILCWASVVGKKEGEGPLSQHFDVAYDDDTLGEETWEKSESRLQKEALDRLLQKSGIKNSDINILFAGDLLNQCIGTAYSLRDLDIPFYGLYGACSTMAESLSLSSLFVDSSLADYACAVTSSHFCSAERQFRLPLEYGGQRAPTSQWTVTGAGALLVGTSTQPPYVKAVSAGKIKDLGIKDINNMGAAMAPAAADTIMTYLQDTNSSPADYDLIVTGDLGKVGSELLIDLLKDSNIDISTQHNDCGLMMFDLSKQDVHAGGSGCGCSASVLCSLLLKELRNGKLQNILFIATGALMSPTSFQQGETIPGIAHLVHLTTQKA